MSEQIKDIFDASNSYQIKSAYSGTDDSIYNLIVKKKEMFPSMYHFWALGLVYPWMMLGFGLLIHLSCFILFEQGFSNC